MNKFFLTAVLAASLTVTSCGVSSIQNAKISAVSASARTTVLSADLSNVLSVILTQNVEQFNKSRREFNKSKQYDATLTANEVSFPLYSLNGSSRITCKRQSPKCVIVDYKEMGGKISEPTSIRMSAVAFYMYQAMPTEAIANTNGTLTKVFGGASCELNSFYADNYTCILDN